MTTQTPVVDLSALDGSTGFRIDGIDGFDESGFSVSSAGDVNGDGFDDVIIGAHGADPEGRFSSGASYVLFGSADPAAVDLSTLDGRTGFRIDGVAGGDRSGRSVSSAGDVNGDGFDDVIIGALFADAGGNNLAGESYVVFGRADPAAAVDLSTLDGSAGFRIDGIDAFDESGRSVSSAGDVNGDGFDDVIIGTFRADRGEELNTGESYVVFGSADPAAAIHLSALDGTNGFHINGVDYGDQSGFSVSSAGDVTGDGFDDVVIGAPSANAGGDTSAGQSYVVFGRADPAAAINLSALDGTNGFRIDGVDAGDESGLSVSSAGDVNGDGLDDVIIGAPFADPGGDFGRAGESYVVFGRADPAATVDLSALDGSNGFRIDGVDADDLFGFSVSSAGDVNRDGFDDVIIGARLADPGGNLVAGESYVVFGGADLAAAVDVTTLDGRTGFRIDGVDAGDESGFSVSSAGDVNGDGFDDLIIGAPEADPGGDFRAGESYVVFGRASPDAGTPPPGEERIMIDVSLVDRGGQALDGAVVNFSTAGNAPILGSVADGAGNYVVSLGSNSPGGTVDAVRDYDESTDPDISAGDALNALRLAVGLDPSFGPATAMDFIAADVDGDTRVSASDALDILRFAVGLETENAPRWVFMDKGQDLSGVMADNVVFEAGAETREPGQLSNPVELTGVLLGNVAEA